MAGTGAASCVIKSQRPSEMKVSMVVVVKRRMSGAIASAARCVKYGNSADR